MVWLNVVTNREMHGQFTDVRLTVKSSRSRRASELLAASDHVEFLDLWTLLSRMLCVCPDSWDPALNVGSEMQLSSYSLDLDTPLRHLASQ